eukprot:CAMPEP_0171497576 /NCGR_PEP_ID=MMETSP0958-20121227/7352_1 /TAXON_ID=87120 /ORGANISM="Aurantiochytrium limacinum, Strain ATCCMYA-1381" /LENGTH=553 /DNA_ID=CAMNT_0012031841 /DNA_START=340 /DNA_END=2001 /DNA_ORIENTATION=-
MGKEEHELASALALLSGSAVAAASSASASSSPPPAPTAAAGGNTTLVQNNGDDSEGEDQGTTRSRRSKSVDADLDGEIGEDGTHSGRFSEEEKTILFNLILKDPDLFRAFVHQLTKRKWGGRSWMNEIAKRFNQLVPHQRKHDAVRHHLKLRKARSPGTGSDEDIIESLLEHSLDCVKSDTCSKCLSLHRVRVRLGYASCGWPSCEYCDTSKPHVLHAFNARALLREIRAKGPRAAASSIPTLQSPSSSRLSTETLPFPSPLNEDSLKKQFNFTAPKAQSPSPLTLQTDMNATQTPASAMAAAAAAAAAAMAENPRIANLLSLSSIMPLSPMLSSRLTALSFDSPKGARSDRSDSSSSLGSEVTQRIPTQQDIGHDNKNAALFGDQAKLLALQMLLNTPRAAVSPDHLNFAMNNASTNNLSPTNDTNKVANLPSMLLFNNNNTSNSLAALHAAKFQQQSQHFGGNPGMSLSTLSSLALGAQQLAALSPSNSSTPIDRSMVLPFNAKLMQLTPKDDGLAGKKRQVDDAFSVASAGVNNNLDSASSKRAKLTSSN